MKRFFLLSAIIFTAGNLISQSNVLNFQFYADTNNNCSFDTGEPTVPALASFSVQYIMAPSGSVSLASANAGCNYGSIPVNSYSLPATNTFVATSFPYTTKFVPNYTCNAWNNLPYGTMAFLPLKHLGNALNQFTVGTTSYLGSALADSIPVCNNIGTDTVFIYYQLPNNFPCPTSPSSRTYSLYFDNQLFEVFTSTATSGGATALGSYGMGHMMEYYGQNSIVLIRTRLPLAVATLGLHKLSMKSTPVFNHPLSTVNFTISLLSIPCANVTGKFFNDCDNNCTYGSSDGVLGSGLSGLAYNPTYTLAFTPDQFGNFSVYMPATSAFSISVTNLVPSFTPCSLPTTTFSGAPSTNTIYIGYKLPAYQDPAVAMWRSSGGTTNPGNTLRFTVTPTNSAYYNCGGLLSNGGSMKVVLPPFFNYSGTSSAPAPTVISSSTGDTLVWSVPNFFTFTSKQFSVLISSTISLQTSYSITASILPAIDNYPANNTCVVTGVIGAPFDPNNKVAFSPKMAVNGDFPPGETLFYTVNFQNVGTAPARNVMTIDTVDVNLDLSSLKVLQSSSPVLVQAATGSREVAFRFNGINLPDATSNEAGSHGFVRYSINLAANCPLNTVISNRAHNYFDYTAPVATNQTKNKLAVEDISGLPFYQPRFAAMNIMPNPADEKIMITSELTIVDIRLSSVTGQLLFTSQPLNKSVYIDCSQLPPGVYFLSGRVADGTIEVKRIVKE
jgi:uncharacterized repeat protein (TIGR01451 family)